ncbi:MAG TPA: RpiB/LacA/LacB family sugar-phosphate isomerase [Tepidisphaeraceae bacterium]|jgi:ribose 5-phosphate isomerase RpiB|nr:RpiB/LacA/LacB family sugar-phosphate isomerase [Tepidisphaeraceae bacterium]
MIVTARQLEDLHRQSGSNGHLTLPYRARLSPLAADWIRAKKVVVGYSDVPVSNGANPPASEPASTPGSPLGSSELSRTAVSQSPTAGSFVWWCDGPCGPAKAAVISQEKESRIKSLDKPNDAKQIVPVIKTIAASVKSGQLSGAVLLVQNGALATIYANRCPSLRAILGTCLEAVEQGVQQAGANVLIIEHPYKTLAQVKNLLSRFVRGKRVLSEDVQRQLQELASCG